MASTNKIQIRRGTTSQWTAADTALRYLSEGELGYDIDLKRFKIGQGNNKPWADHPWAGGFEPIAQTGIGLTFNSSTNAYSFYSYITGVAGGQAGITFETLPISGLLNDVNASGTYYRIGLSTKLENFHDSSISISDNLISSSGSVDGTGITISGFNSSAISLNPFGGTVNASGINIRNLTNSITVTEAVGGLDKGTVLSSASGITDVLKKMLEKIFEPTCTANADLPSLSMSFGASPGSVANGGNIEAGTVGNVTINASFSQGTVRGTGLGAGWVTNGNQGVRAGAATSYTIFGQSMSLTTSRALGSQTVADGNTTYGNHSVAHGTGIVPKNSIDANSTTLTQLGANASLAGNSVSFNGVRNLFYGTSTDVLEPPSSGFIRTLTSSSNPSANTKFTMTIPVNTRTVIIAVPSGSTYASVANSAFGVKNNSTQLGVTFSSTGISIPGANNYSPITYKVWYLTNDGPLETSVNYSVALNGVFS